MFELEKYSGCLAHKKTPDGAARRRKPSESDEDQWMMIGGNNFSVDASGKIATSKALRRLGAKLAKPFFPKLLVKIFAMQHSELL